MELNNDVNRALTALLKELEHIKDLTSVADGYREVAQALSSSLAEFHTLTDEQAKHLCGLAERVSEESEASINSAKEGLSSILRETSEFLESMKKEDLVQQINDLDVSMKCSQGILSEKIQGLSTSQEKNTQFLRTSW